MSNNAFETPQYGLRTVFAENHVFYHDFSNKARLEVSFEVGDNGFQKFKFQIQELIPDPENPQKKKQKDRLMFYLDPKDIIGEFVPLIQNGIFKERAVQNLKNSVAALQKGEKVAPAILFKRIGGTMKRAEDGKAVYREFRIERSNLNDQYWNSTDPRQKMKSKSLNYVIKIMSCEGRLLQQGKSGQTLIQPAKGNDGRLIDVHAINFPITEIALRAIAGSAVVELGAYRTSQYVTMEVQRRFELFAEKLDQITASTKPSVPQSSKVETSPNVDTVIREEEKASVTHSEGPTPTAEFNDDTVYDINDISLDIDADDLPF